MQKAILGSKVVAADEQDLEFILMDWRIPWSTLVEGDEQPYRPHW